MRTSAVVLLLVAGALLTFAANLTVWANRTIFDTDTFVSTADRVFEDEDVQDQLSVRLADEIIVRAEVEQRLRTRLPEGLEALALPLLTAVRNLIEDAALRALQGERTEEALNGALTRVHGRLIALLEDRDRSDAAIQTEDGQIVIDLRDVLLRVADDLGARDPEGVLARLDVPEGSGQIVLVDDADSLRPIGFIARNHQAITIAIVIAAVAVFALAALVAARRQPVIRNAGIIVAVIGVLSALLIVPVRAIAGGYARNEDAGRAAADALMQGFRYQSVLLAVAGLAIALLAVVFGPSRLARNLRSAARDGATRTPDFAPAIRNAAPLLRAFGLAVAALALIAWPDPSLRVYLTLLALLGVYLGALWLISSDSERATDARDRVEAGWRRINPPPGVTDAHGARGWVTAHAGSLRIGSVVLALGVLLLWPGMTLAAFVVIVALALLFLAAVDWVAVKPEAEDPSA